MKKITIGRGRECNIRLSDSSDKVSRRQAVITVSPFGKMMIYDTSANGTYVNGERIEKPNGKPIKRGDNINFAHVADLDWTLVRNPYRKMFVSIFVILIIAAAGVGAYILWGDQLTKLATGGTSTKVETPTAPKDSIAEVNDSLTLEIPKETPTPALRDTRDNNPRQGRIVKDLVKPTEEPAPQPAVEEPAPTPEFDDPSLDEMMNKKH